MTQTLTDRKLIDIYIADNPESQQAIDELADRHGGAVTAAVDKFADQYLQNPDRQELRQEVWAKLLSCLHTYDPDKGGFANFIYVAARSCIVNMSIKQNTKKRQAITTEIDASHYSEIPDRNSRAAIERILVDERIERARAKIKKKLPDRALAILDGMLLDKDFADDPAVEKYGIKDYSVYTTARDNVRRFIRTRMIAD